MQQLLSEFGVFEETSGPAFADLLDRENRAQINFAVGDSSLGLILVATNERGVCAILIGDDSEKLIADLQNRFPGIDAVRDDEGFEPLIAKVMAFVDAPSTGFDLPFDIGGTIFQRQVWEALREIPMGSTASYTDIANRIGSPRSVRAVAQACAANPLAVVIPCHRVVRSDGVLSGYRWGIERKRMLLEREVRA